MLSLKALKNIACLTLAFALIFSTNIAKADCAKDLYSCGKAAGTLGYEILENSADMLAYIVAGGPCIAAMSAGDPTTITFTGMIMGLGATGIVRPHENDCKADIYGVAAKPIASLIDKVLSTNKYSKEIEGAGAQAVEGILGGVPLPPPIPSVSLQIGCGCHLLGTGAKAIDNAREVAQAADAAYKKCGKAKNSCPGLRQALDTGKWLINGVGDAVEFVGDTACKLADGDGPAVTPDHMYHTHFEYMLNSQLEQDLADIPMEGSPHQNQFNAELGFCKRHYDNRCQDGGRICTAIALQSYNPTYHPLLLEQLNGKLFNKYFFEHSDVLSSHGVSGCPAPGGISLSGNDGGANAILTNISNRCAEEVTAIIEGKNGGTSYKELARAGLPQTIDGWLPKIPTGKWITDSRKVYQLAIINASFAVDPLVVAVQDKYKVEYKKVADQGEVAAIPYDYLDKTYRGWTFFKMAGGINKCPAGLTNYKGHDTLCVADILSAFGYAISPAVTKGEFQKVEDVVGTELKGSAVYDIARAEFMRDMQNQAPVVKYKEKTQEEKNEIAYTRAKNAWKNAAEPAASQAADNIIPQILAKAGERESDVRSAQESKFIDLQSSLKGKYEEYIKKCNGKACSDAMYQKWVTLVDKINAERTALQQVTKPNKAFDATKFEAVINQYKQEIINIEPQFKSIVSSASNQANRRSADINLVEKLTKEKKAEALNQPGPRSDGSSPTLKDQSKGNDLSKGLNKLAGESNSRLDGEAKPQVRGMRAAPGMIAATNKADKYQESKSGGLTSNSFKPSSAPDSQDGKPAAVTSLEESQNALKNRVGSQGIKDEMPSRVGAGFDIAKPAAPSAVLMPRAIGLPATANASEAAQQNTQGGRLSPGVSIAANSPPSAALPPIRDMTKPADNVGSGNLNNTRGLAAMPVGNIGSSVAVSAATNVGVGRTPSGAPTANAPPPVRGIANNTSLAPSAAPMAPFDRQQYQRVARQNLEAKWVPQCKNEPCKSEISALVAKRINEVLRMLDTGTDLRNNGILVATEAKMDATYNPQMQARIDASVPKAVDNTPVTAPLSTVPVEGVKNINSIKKRNF